MHSRIRSTRLRGFIPVEYLYRQNRDKLTLIPHYTTSHTIPPSPFSSAQFLILSPYLDALNLSSRSLPCPPPHSLRRWLPSFFAISEGTDNRQYGLRSYEPPTHSHSRRSVYSRTCQTAEPSSATSPSAPSTSDVVALQFLCPTLPSMPLSFLAFHPRLQQIYLSDTALHDQPVSTVFSHLILVVPCCPP